MKVAVIMGGKSPEREVSLNTGRNISQSLEKAGYTVSSFDLDDNLVAGLQKFAPDVVFIALHGAYGEDGCVQGLLEVMDLPYTGSGVLASALAMDKIMAKKYFYAEGIPTPPAIYLNNEAELEVIAPKLDYPLVVKPSAAGSAIGVTILVDEKKLKDAVTEAFRYSRQVILEKYIKGKELTVGVLGNGEALALPVIEICPKNQFYDYEAKYAPGMSDHLLPAPIAEDTYKKVQTLGLRAHQILGCRGMSRIDVLLDEDDNAFVIDVNTIPGMTATSLFPEAAAFMGISFEELLKKIINLALEDVPHLSLR